jgi:hypothetical protein
MPVPNEPTTLHLEVTDTKEQQNYYTELLMWHKRALRVVIEVDSYDQQSSARLDIFAGTVAPAWAELATSHWSEMASKAISRQRKPDIADYAEDRAVLVHKAGMLLGFIDPNQ